MADRYEQYSPPPDDRGRFGRPERRSEPSSSYNVVRERPRARESSRAPEARDREDPRDRRRSRAPEARDRREAPSRQSDTKQRELKKRPGMGDLLGVANDFGQGFKEGVGAYQTVKKGDLVGGAIKGAMTAAKFGGAVMDAYDMVTGQEKPKDVPTKHHKTLRRTKGVIAGMSGAKQYLENRSDSSDSPGTKNQKRVTRGKARDTVSKAVLETISHEVGDSIDKQVSRLDMGASTPRPVFDSPRSLGVVLDNRYPPIGQEYGAGPVDTSSYSLQSGSRIPEYTLSRQQWDNDVHYGAGPVPGPVDTSLYSSQPEYVRQDSPPRYYPSTAGGFASQDAQYYIPEARPLTPAERPLTPEVQYIPAERPLTPEARPARSSGRNRSRRRESSRYTKSKRRESSRYRDE